MTNNKDAFDLWWEWADKPVDNKPTIGAAIYDALPPDERRDRAKVMRLCAMVSKVARCVPPEVRIDTAFRRRRNRSAACTHSAHRRASVRRNKSLEPAFVPRHALPRAWHITVTAPAWLRWGRCFKSGPTLFNCALGSWKSAPGSAEGMVS
jgi:hypothetical protein